ncbi:MAG: XRE family transcriptional regulator [Acidobacteria bacterium]|nr:MAG: XRE family transcriptional regulator [Acidobacteriota bacterium]
MLEVMKKHHIEIHISIPETRKEEIVKLLKLNGIDNVKIENESIPFEESESFKNRIENNHAGTVLRGARKKEGFTQKQLAKLTNIFQHHISEMENGKRSIGKKNAKLFGKILNIDYRVFF